MFAGSNLAYSGQGGLEIRPYEMDRALLHWTGCAAGL